MKPTLDLDAAAEALRGAHRTGRALDELDPEARPHSLADGYSIQDRFHQQSGARLVGWKVGCTSAAAQQILATSEPFAGRLRADARWPTGSHISIDRFPSVPALEVEVGVVVQRRLASLPADPLDLASAVHVVAAVELVASRFRDWSTVGTPSLIADNGVAAGVVTSEPMALPLEAARSLDTIPVELTMGGKPIASSTGAEALGHPLAVLHWLVGHALRRGSVLERGDLVITGTCTGLVPATPGLPITGRVGDQTVELTLVG